MTEQEQQTPVPQWLNKRFLPYYVGGAACLLLICGAIFYSILIGKTRRAEVDAAPVTEVEATSTVALVARHLDGVLVEPGFEDAMPRAVMIDNMVDARPWSGVTDASLVIEAPAEGGITRFLAFYDGYATATKIGPIRSARPYYLDWVMGWDAAYFHVGGSPDAIERLGQLGSSVANIDEMARGKYFWRSADRSAPHNTYTSQELMTSAVSALGFASTTFQNAWHFQDMAASSTRGDVTSIRVPYGGSYTTGWTYDKEQGIYTRTIGGKPQKQLDGQTIEVENVIVIKTDSQVLDDKGRLRVRTTGGGDAILYRDGNRYAARWRRSAGEPIRLETTDGRELLLTRGKTWLHVTTDDVVFGGV